MFLSVLYLTIFTLAIEIRDRNYIFNANSETYVGQNNIEAYLWRGWDACQERNCNNVELDVGNSITIRFEGWYNGWQARNTMIDGLVKMGKSNGRLWFGKTYGFWWIRGNGNGDWMNVYIKYNSKPGNVVGNTNSGLQTMNNLRARNGKSALSYDKGLENDAQWEANTLANRGCQLQHLKFSNLYMSSTKCNSQSIDNAVASWIAEGPGPFPAHGHYTMILGQNGVNIARTGCAMAGSTCCVVSCNYS
ncbi:hypothetical protein BC833DRAFT_648741 [Globomyces pollinis-pini]|nr:hypothetical protein BC833DRAFT_648741 [Globomyces pollinis-pini]KAJ2997205.1 hypothetical protein HDV02_005803 [Globomyces sp. JEL0801]